MFIYLYIYVYDMYKKKMRSLKFMTHVVNIIGFYLNLMTSINQILLHNVPFKQLEVVRFKFMLILSGTQKRNKRISIRKQSFKFILILDFNHNNKKSCDGLFQPFKQHVHNN